MNELALFAGAGGGLLGSVLLGWRTVCAVEKEPYCREVLLRRQRDGMLDLFPIWDDVRTFDGKPWRGVVDIVTAGFPCQPFSVAGRRAKEDDERNLWPDTIRVIREVEPRFCLLENVPGLLSCSYIRRIFGDLAASGYDCRWDCISAASVGAPHIRDRLWIVADAKRTKRWKGCTERRRMERKDGISQRQEGPSRIRARCEDVPYSMQERCNRRTGAQETAGERRRVPAERDHPWSAEPDVGRVADGMAFRVDRLKALGNGQVPAVVRAAWMLLGE